MAIDYFERWVRGPRAVRSIARVFSLDHYCPAQHAGDTDVSRAHPRFAAAARCHGVRGRRRHQPSGRDRARARRAGDLVIGADSHTVTCGAPTVWRSASGRRISPLPCSPAGSGCASRKRFASVPRAARAPGGRQGRRTDTGRPLGADGANYCAIEFAGPGLESLSFDDRLVISNLMVEGGAKAAVFRASAGGTGPARRRHMRRHVPTLRLSIEHAAVARPHAPDNVGRLADAAGTPVDMVFIGTCTGGRVVDFHDALEALHGERAAAWRRAFSWCSHPRRGTSTTRSLADGTMDAFLRAGAVLTETGCGACCGTSGVIPARVRPCSRPPIEISRRAWASDGRDLPGLAGGVRRRGGHGPHTDPRDVRCMTSSRAARASSVTTSTPITSFRPLASRRRSMRNILKEIPASSRSPDSRPRSQPGDILVAGTKLRVRLGDGGRGHGDPGRGHSGRARAQLRAELLPERDQQRPAGGRVRHRAASRKTTGFPSH